MYGQAETSQYDMLYRNVSHKILLLQPYTQLYSPFAIQSAAGKRSGRISGTDLAYT